MKIDFISDINKDNYYILDYDRIDLYMIKIAWWNAAFFALYAFGIYYFAPAALYPSPFSWRVVNLTETLWTVAIALFAAFLPAVLRGRFKNHYLYRFIPIGGLTGGGSLQWLCTTRSLTISRQTGSIFTEKTILLFWRTRSSCCLWRLLPQKPASKTGNWPTRAG